MAQQLEAALLFIEGRRGEALVLARQAAVVEDSLSFEFGPPVPVKPAYELVGEMLMDLRQPKEAMQAFELSLKKNPRRALSLLGLGRAATMVKDTATARRAYGELQQDLEARGQEPARAQRDRRGSSGQLISRDSQQAVRLTSLARRGSSARPLRTSCSQAMRP